MTSVWDGEGTVEMTGAGMAGGPTALDAESGAEVCRGDRSGVRRSMRLRLFAQSTNGLCWCNQLNPRTAEISELSGVTRKLTGITVPGAK
jgi:hypothetical protein